MEPLKLVHLVRHLLFPCDVPKKNDMDSELQLRFNESSVFHHGGVCKFWHRHTMIQALVSQLFLRLTNNVPDNVQIIALADFAMITTMPAFCTVAIEFAELQPQQVRDFMLCIAEYTRRLFSSTCDSFNAVDWEEWMQKL